MRIGLDCRLGGLAHAGIGRYIEQLVGELLDLMPANQLVLFFSSTQQVRSSQIFTSAKKRGVEIILAKVAHYSFAEQVKLVKIFNDANLDLLHVPHFNVPLLYQKPTLITIHDLLWHQYQGTTVTTQPKAIYWLKYLGYRVVSSQALKKARAIMVPTKFVKTEILKRYPNYQDKITVTYEGVNTSHFKKISRGEFQKKWPSLRDPYILSVGSLYPHKNVGLILEALRDFSDLKLAIVGSRNVFQDKFKRRVKELGLTKQVEFLGFIDDAELGSIYQYSLALVQPSLSEGFGLTGLEAMMQKTRVLASDINVFREVYGDHALFFDPHSATSLSNKIKQVLRETNASRREKIGAAHHHASQFSWNKLAKQTLSLYQKIGHFKP